MTIHQRHRLHAARVATAAAVCTVLAAAASCGTHHDGSTPAHPTGTARTSTPTPSPTPTPPLTQAQALAQIARYVRINNAANSAARHGDLKKARALNGQIEIGELHESSLAEFTEMKVMDAKDKAGFYPFYYVNSSVYIPREYPETDHQTPPYFYAITSETAHPKDPKAKRTPGLLVFVKSGSFWKIAAAMELDQKAPAIATDQQGNAIAVDPETDGLAMRPTLLSEAIQDNYTTGGKLDGKLLSASKDTKYDRTWVKDWNKSLAPGGHLEVIADGDPYGTTYALRTVDGGALVVTTRKMDANYAGQPTPQGMGSITIPAHDFSRAWVHHGTTPLLSETYACADLGAIPGHGAGPTEQLGEDCELVHASG